MLPCPFFGTGTTGAVAKRLGRNWIGIERDEAYVQVAIARIERVEEEFLAPRRTPTKRELPRIPFKTLLQQGLLSVGDSLYFRRNPEAIAIITQTGKIIFRGSEGSIHKIARGIQGGPCNGWEHWYFKNTLGEMQPIDVLREQVRQNQAAEPMTSL